MVNLANIYLLFKLNIMREGMKIVNINGPINSGKSTVLKALVRQIAKVKNYFVVYKELEAKVEGYKGTITGFSQKH